MKPSRHPLLRALVFAACAGVLVSPPPARASFPMVMSGVADSGEGEVDALVQPAHCRAVWHTHRRCVRWSGSRCIAWRSWRHRC